MSGKWGPGIRFKANVLDFFLLHTVQNVLGSIRLSLSKGYRGDLFQKYGSWDVKLTSHHQEYVEA
jgi:hypothetical protein